MVKYKVKFNTIMKDRNDFLRITRNKYYKIIVLDGTIYREYNTHTQNAIRLNT